MFLFISYVLEQINANPSIFKVSEYCFLLIKYNKAVKLALVYCTLKPNDLGYYLGGLTPPFVEH